MAVADPLGAERPEDDVMSIGVYLAVCAFAVVFIALLWLLTVRFELGGTA